MNIARHYRAYRIRVGARLKTSPRKSKQGHLVHKIGHHAAAAATSGPRGAVWTIGLPTIPLTVPRPLVGGVAGWIRHREVLVVVTIWVGDGRRVGAWVADVGSVVVLVVNVERLVDLVADVGSVVVLVGNARRFTVWAAVVVWKTVEVLV